VECGKKTCAADQHHNEELHQGYIELLVDKDRYSEPSHFKQPRDMIS
jgi:hypothetical protein